MTTETPPQDTPPQDTPPQDTPPQDTPPQDTPPQDTPPQDTPPAGHFSANLSGELANHPGMQRFSDVTALGKSYLELETKLSSLGPRIPGEGASEEDIQKYREVIGVPSDTNGYEWDTSVSVPEELPLDSEMVGEMLTAMHTAGLTKEQVKIVGQAYVDSQANQVQGAVVDAKKSKDEAVSTLKKEWGASFKANVDSAKRAMQSLWGQDDYKKMAMKQLKDGTMLGNDPEFLRAMATVGDTYAEHDVHGMAQRARLTKTPEEATAELAKLDGDVEFQAALHDKHHPGHAAAVQKRADLYAMKAAGG
jgi:hypothetical protein